jgi:ribonuclease HI
MSKGTVLNLSSRRPLKSAPATSNADILLVFDGGALGNPGKGYGSFISRGLVEYPQKVELQYGNQITNNEAEYLTLNHGLRRILLDIDEQDRDASTVSIEVRSDSQLVVEQVNGRWKVRHARMRPLHAEALELLNQFGTWSVIWHPRIESVRLFGH